MYKVRIVEHVYKLKKDKDGNEISRFLYDTIVYNCFSHANTKKLARRIVNELTSTKKEYRNDDYHVIISAGKVWETEETNNTGIIIPEEKEVNRDVDWRNTILQLA